MSRHVQLKPLTEAEASALLTMATFAEAGDLLELFRNGHQVNAALRAIEKLRTAVYGK